MKNLNKTNSDNVFIIRKKPKGSAQGTLCRVSPERKFLLRNTECPHLGPFSQQAGSYYFKGFIHIDKKRMPRCCISAQRTERPPAMFQI